MRQSFVLVVFICLFFSISAQDITHTLGANGQFLIKSESNAELLNINRAIPNHSEFIFKNQGTDNTDFYIYNAGNNELNFNLRKSLGTSDSPGNVELEDVLGNINFEGFFGSAWHPGASIVSVVEGTPSGSVVPAKLEFKTANTSAPATRMTINADGTVDFTQSAFFDQNITIAQDVIITFLAAPGGSFTPLLIDDNGVLFTDPSKATSYQACEEIVNRLIKLEKENAILKKELLALKTMIENMD